MGNVMEKDTDKGQQYMTQERPKEPKKPAVPTDDEIQKKIIENQEYIDSQIVKKDGKTIYYFTQERNLSNNKANAQYYRIILGTTAKGYCAVQDFYSNGNKKREPFIITVAEDCSSLKGFSTDELFKTKITYHDDGDMGVIIYNQQEKFYIFLSKDHHIYQINEIDVAQQKRIEHYIDNKEYIFGNEMPNSIIYSFSNKQIQDIYMFGIDGKKDYTSHHDFNNKRLLVWESQNNEQTNLAEIRKYDEQDFANLQNKVQKQVYRVIEDYTKLYQTQQQNNF